MDHIQIEDSQWTERRTTLDIVMPIKLEDQRESQWSTPTGGAETKTSESTSTWERDTISDQLSLASITSQFSKRPKNKTKLGPLSEPLKKPNEHEKTIEKYISIERIKKLFKLTQ